MGLLISLDLGGAGGGEVCEFEPHLGSRDYFLKNEFRYILVLNNESFRVEWHD